MKPEEMTNEQLAAHLEAVPGSAYPMRVLEVAKRLREYDKLLRDIAELCDLPSRARDMPASAYTDPQA